jgi:2-dehydro-3-deoxygluconokinase
VLKLGHTPLAGAEDSALLESECTVDQLLRPLRDANSVEAVVKPEEPGAIVMPGEREAMVPVPEAVMPVDTTAAGDSFAAALLAAHLSGASPGAAVPAGHRFAGTVIR